MVDPFLPDADKIAALRAALPATGAGAYLDTATAGPLPSEMIAAAREVEDWDVRTGRVGPGQDDETEQRLDETRAVLAAMVGGDPREIALTHGAAPGIAAAAFAADWQPGDRLLTVAGVDHGAMAALIGVAQRMDVTLDVVPIPPDADPDDALARLAAAMTPATRVVVLPHVEPRSGAVWPIARAADAVHQRGAWLVVDGSHGLGAVPAAVRDLDADAYAVDGHRWLLGPQGIGALWLGERVLADGRIALGGPGTFESVGDGTARPWPDARRFETGSFHRPSVVALGRSVGWLEMYLGVPWIHERVAHAAIALHERLADVEGVDVVTPVRRLGPIVTFTIRGWRPTEAYDELARRSFLMASVVASPDGIRTSVGAFTTDEELDRVTESIRLLAAHTPATLPRRPTLVVVRQVAERAADAPPPPGTEAP
jgi:L-cysteine/cystine lyase